MNSDEANFIVHGRIEDCFKPCCEFFIREGLSLRFLSKFQKYGARKHQQNRIKALLLITIKYPFISAQRTEMPTYKLQPN